MGYTQACLLEAPSAVPLGAVGCCLVGERRGEPEPEPALWAASPSVLGSGEASHSTAQGRVLGMVSDGVTATSRRRAAC